MSQRAATTVPGPTRRPSGEAFFVCVRLPLTSHKQTAINEERSRLPCLPEALETPSEPDPEICIRRGVAEPGKDTARPGPAAFKGSRQDRAELLAAVFDTEILGAAK